MSLVLNPMRVQRRLLHATLGISSAFVLLLALPSAGASADESQVLRGYTATAVADELKYEHEASIAPSPDAAQRYEHGVAGVVHRMGQPTDYQTAVFFRDRLIADGWDAKIVTYVVPIAWPTQQTLEITTPNARQIDLYEPAVPSDPWTHNHAAIGKPYSGYSADGDVRGPLIYAGHATKSDLAMLAKLHVSVNGAIVLAQMGGAGAQDKARRLQRLGAQALLIYPEPGYDPYYPQFHSSKTYPDGPGRPLGAALRNTMDIEEANGDPTAIGIPVPGAPHKPWSVIKVPKIPVMTVTALVAQQLVRDLAGPAAPAALRTKIKTGVKIGGNEQVHLVLTSRRFFGPMWNVIGTMKGDVAPEQTIIVGGHRDAWTYGAIDPGSGSVAMLQMAEAFGKLYKQGWRPYRTIRIASWDGEELNEFGSGIWTDQYKDELLHRCWAYINTDEIAFGPVYTAGATDDLIGVTQSVADIATAPNGTSQAAYWAKQDPKRVVTPNGTGSDHESFEYHLNIPALGIAYAGVFGTYHSGYEDIASLRIFDPGMRYADAAASFYSVVTMRLADAVYPDIRYQADALAVQRRLNAFANGRDDEARRAKVVRTLQPYVNQFSALAANLDNAVDASSKTGNAQTLRSLGSLAFQIRMAFYTPGGIIGHPYQGSVLYNSDDTISTLPSLETTLDPKKGSAALSQLVAAFKKLPPILVVSR